ncbi:MAG: hypothetical protein H6567_03035 [Lewinellaceae bacterium]|nr:hypothetical protein [Lewinellaceae bacterium]
MRRAFYLSFIIIGFILSGCKKEPEIIKGCQDSLADNYVANADEDDGSCTYQKRYLGNYVADIVCDGAFKDAFSMGSLSINETIDKSTVSIIIQTNIGPLPVAGTITRDSLKVDAVLQDLNIDKKLINSSLDEGTVLTDITLKSTMSISSDNKNLAGPLSAVIKTKEDIFIFGVPIAKGFEIKDNCTIDAVKQ